MGQKRKGKAQPPEEAPAEYEFVWADGIQLRIVRPYRHCFRTYAKARWVGRSLHEVCATEFGARTPEYYREAITDGRMRVDGCVIDPEYVLCNGDAITHETIRHEPPVLASWAPRAEGVAGDEQKDSTRPASTIAVVGRTDELVAVDKPPTLPVHPSGAYYHNTMLHILGCEQPQWQRGVSSSLHPVHRLDRLTSGLMLLATAPAVARRVCEEIASGKVRKEYFARVRGRFPLVTSEEEMPHSWREATARRVASAIDTQDGSDAQDREANGKVVTDVAGSAGSLDAPRAGGGTSSGLSYTSLLWSADGAVRLICPLRCASHRDGVHECHPEGRFAATAFFFVGYDDSSNTSLVRCTPVTGRTHQIRVHLQQLGFPIANDPCYGGDIDCATRQTGDADVAADVNAEGLASGSCLDADDRGTGGTTSVVGSPAPAFTETQLRCRGIWLHALRYTGPGFSFETAPPPWASPFMVADGGSDQAGDDVCHEEGVRIEPARTFEAV